MRNELLRWIESNLTARWESISRKGRVRLADMFTGYKQQQGLIWEVLLAFEKFMYEHHQFDKALDHISSWDASDLRRLVSAFIGTRYPMALALNKSDESSAEYFISQINQSLPIHGAHVGIGLCAHQEMLYVQKFIPVSGENCKIGCEKGTKPIGVWDTLHWLQHYRCGNQSLYSQCSILLHTHLYQE